MGYDTTEVRYFVSQKNFDIVIIYDTEQGKTGRKAGYLGGRIDSAVQSLYGNDGMFFAGCIMDGRDEGTETYTSGAGNTLSEFNCSLSVVC